MKRESPTFCENPASSWARAGSPSSTQVLAASRPSLGRRWTPVKPRRPNTKSPDDTRVEATPGAMTVRSRDLLEACLDALRQHALCEARLREDQPSRPREAPRLRLEIELNGQVAQFDPEVLPTLRLAQVGPLVHRLRQLESQGLRPLICTARIPDPVGHELRAHRVAYLDRSGNAWLSAPGMRILVTGRPPAGGRADRLSLRGTEIRLLGVFLRDPAAGARIQTELAEQADIALGAVGSARDQLTRLGLLERTGERSWRVRDRAAGLERFGTGWAMAVRHKLRPQTYRVLDPLGRGDLEERIAATGSQLGCLLGGERAAAHLTGYLSTEHATLHVPQGQRKLLCSALALAPDPLGPVTMLDRYGLEDRYDLPRLPEVPLIHPLWIWAECLTLADERVVQTAARLYEQLLAAADA